MRDGVSLIHACPAFWLGLRYDARTVAAALLPVLVLGSVPVLNPFRNNLTRRVWFVFLGLFVVALIIFYTADILHFLYLGQRLNATALSFLGDASISAEMVWQSYPLLRIALGVVATACACMAAITRLYRRTLSAVVVPRKAIRVTWFVATLLFCLVAIFGRLGQYPLRWSDAFSLRHAASAQLALNPIESFLNSLTFRTTGFDLEKVREHYLRMSAYLGVTSPDANRLTFDRSVPAMPERTTVRQPNVILVICESFSAYKSSMWGNPLDTTPFFNGLTKQGVFFDNCFTPHFGTARGVWATITGTPDVSLVETASRNPAMVDQHTIMDDFVGYEKHYFIGGSSSWANIRGLLMNNIKGLNLHEEDSYDSPRVDVWGISDNNLFREADKVLRTQTKPFFAIIQTSDNHRPYTIPKEDQAEFKKVDLPEATVRQYGFESLAELNAFRYTDFAFQKFFEKARQSAYFDNTIFVFVGDHGINGNAGTMFPPAWTENRLTSFHVPLLFYAPKLLPPQRLHSVASQVDILPTIAGIANVAYRNRTFGRDLLRQQQLDGGAGNVAFIIDHNDKTIGVVKQQYYGMQRPDGRYEVLWTDFATTPAAEAPSEAQRLEYRTLTNAFHETARYLLLQNQKTSPEPVGSEAKLFR
jgi:phosphoglycerol transferase MdoB-like AlkP superfamily enzyme